MLVVDCLITILVTAVITLIFCYLFFLRRILTDMNMERSRYYKEMEINFEEAMKEKVDEIEETKEDYAGNLIKKK